MEQLIVGIATMLGIDHELLLALIPIIILVAQLVGKSIPDDATGPLAAIRRIAKVIGLYRSNKISPGVTVADIARGAQDIVAPQQK